MKIRLPAVLSAFLLVLSLTLLPVAAEGDADPAQTPAGKDGQTVTAKATSATAGGDSATNSNQTASATKADTAGVPVSYGLCVLSARHELVFSGLCGNEVSFDAEGICRAMNMSIGSLSRITLVSLPDPDIGTLFVGATGAAVGQSIPASSLSLLSFASAKENEPCRASLSFTVNGGGYPVKCSICLVPAINYTPTVALAPTVSLEVMTYTDIPVTGTLSAYDPEGDELNFEIVSYAAHGRITLTDKHNGAYTYTPDQGYTGRDSFTYVVYDTCGNYSTSATVSVRVSTPPAGVTYADLDGEACAAAVLRVSSFGIMNGTRVGTADYFRPAVAMTRAEFLVTVMDAVGLTPSDADSAPTGFADEASIPANMRPYVALAVNKGAVTGKTQNGKLCFCPDEIISRAEAAVILSNVIGYAKDTTVTAFADEDSLPEWSVPAMTSLRSLGLLAPTDNAARPSDPITRGEAAVWLSRTLQLMGR